MMNRWINQVLIPWKMTKPPGAIPILVLDMYCIHMMGTMNGIQSLGMEVLYILAGCTYLCQPVDVGLNKSIKCGMREKWEECMLEGDGLVDGVAKEPSQKQVAEWLLDVYNNIPRETGGMHGRRKDMHGFDCIINLPLYVLI